MLPEITLKNVSRDNVNRIAWWLEDKELSSRWFGHYGCGDPIHRGYDPRHMLEATEAEWERVFADSHRLIFSIYDDRGEHVGECQAILDGQGGAELALLIGRRDLWHRGYGTSAVITLMDKVFGAFDLDKVWVNVPEESVPALGLFEKLEFKRESTRELCKRADGTALCVAIMNAMSYHARWSRESSREASVPVVTIAGLPGSGSESIGANVARMTGTRFVDEEISYSLCQRLGCSPGELASLEASYRSFWGRFLNSITVPMEWSAAYDSGYYLFRSVPGLDDEAPEGHVTKKQYSHGLAAVVRALSMEGKVVLHGHGSHLFVPPQVATLKVFVSASPVVRSQRIAAEQELAPEEAQRVLKQADRDTVSTCKDLLGFDMADLQQYDLTLNMDTMSLEAATRIVVGAVRAAVPPLAPRPDAQPSAAMQTA